MSTLDSQIDDLYQQPLDEFIAARQALAKALSGDDRKRVAALRKPLALPWAVNQTYWRSRRVYDALLDAGEKLRVAQVGALKGKSTDVRGAAARHADALTKAVGEATKIAEAAGVAPQPDALRRMFEAVSTRTSLPAPHGRFLEALEPAGFEALAGISITAPPGGAACPPADRSKTASAGTTKEPPAKKVSDLAAQRKKQKQAETHKRRLAAIKTAEKNAALAVEAEKRARAAWERAKQDVKDADQALADLLASDE